MNIIVILASAVLAAVPAPQAPAPAQPVGQVQLQPSAEMQKLGADLDAARATIARQELAVDNAGVQVEQLRSEMKLKDELLVLGRDRNAELYKIASEVLDRLASRRNLEPFVQTRRVAMENLVQSYEDKLRAARVLESTLPPSVEAQMRADLNGAAPTDTPKP